MGRADPRATALGLILAALGCDADVTLIETPLEIDAPVDDRDRLVALEMEVWPVDARACPEQSLWRTAVCGEACTDAPSPTDRGEVPIASARLDKTPTGDWGGLDLPVSGSGPWQLLVVGVDAESQPVLHGCQLIRSGNETKLSLWRPWCGAGSCRAQYAQVCDVAVDCTRVETDNDPEFIPEPTCTVTSTVLYLWQEDGVPCDPAGDEHYAPCRPAHFACVPGMIDPITDGQCPRAPPEPLACGATVEEDVDCDDKYPGPCGGCMAGDIRACTSDRTTLAQNCIGVATCQRNGEWGECTRQRETETCNGEDNDCDGRPDEADPDAVTSCNVGEPDDAPKADSCLSGRCACGSRPACGRNQGCCDGICTDLTNSERHCGACGVQCRGTCSRGLCDGVVITPRPDAGHRDTGPTDNGRHADVPPVDRGVTLDATPVDRGFRDAEPVDRGLHRDADPADSGVHDDAEPTDNGRPMAIDSGRHLDAQAVVDSGRHRDADPADTGRHLDADPVDSGSRSRDATTSTTGMGGRPGG